MQFNWLSFSAGVLLVTESQALHATSCEHIISQFNKPSGTLILAHMERPSPSGRQRIEMWSEVNLNDSIQSINFKPGPSKWFADVCGVSISKINCTSSRILRPAHGAIQTLLLSGRVKPDLSSRNFTKSTLGKWRVRGKDGKVTCNERHLRVTHRVAAYVLSARGVRISRPGHVRYRLKKKGTLDYSYSAYSLSPRMKLVYRSPVQTEVCTKIQRSARLIDNAAQFRP